MFAKQVLALLVLCLGAVAPTAFAQGAQTGTISGTIRSTDELPLPGATITATSADLQGPRTAVTDGNGVYFLRGLAPGAYRIEIDMPGFKSALRTDVQLRVGGVADVNAVLPVAGIAETVTVTAPAPAPAANPGTALTYKKAVVDVLPVGRRPTDIAEMAAGVTTNTFNTGQLTVAGSFGFDNVFMVNGVDVNDNVQGTSNNLFIEDAVRETSVLAHGVSAEYGRFSGGVINVVTRSGGNFFSGSFREGLSNPAWIGETPLQKAAGQENASVLSKTHEGTFGGPIVRDRLWFFGAARRETANMPSAFAQNGAAYMRTEKNARGEAKFTATVTPGQTVQASFIENATTQANMSAIPPAALLDASTLFTRELPNRLFAVNYNGAVTPRLFATLQYSQKHQSFRNNGGTSTDIMDSPFRTIGANAGVPATMIYQGPYFDANDPEQRNNRQITGSLAYLLSSPGYGTHELKGGAEHFVSSGIGGNSQSSTGYVFATDYLTLNGAPVRDASGSPVPRFIPGQTQIWNFQATRGAKVDIKTTSLYAQDRWIVSPRLTLDLGTRFEMVNSDATGDITAVDTWSIVPRLAASYALQEGGQTVLYSTYGHYSGKYGQVQFGVNSNVGRPNEVDYVYSGPAGEGADFAPGFDLANYTRVVFASFPTANVQMADGIRSPLTREFTLGLGRDLGRRGHAKATYAWRHASGFVEDFIDLSQGVTDIPLVGTVTNKFYDNADDLYRDYRAAIFESNYRVFGNLQVNGHYTLQLRNHGNFAGEAASQPGIPSVYGNYPEVLGPALDRLMPEGRLDNFQRHKLRVYATYAQGLGRFGSIDVAPLWRVNSGGVYSLTVSRAISAQQLANNPGYPTADISAATRQTVFFGGRGAYEFKGYGVMDLATSYNVPVWKTVKPWVKLEVYNLFNNQKQIAWDRTVTADATSPLDANGIPTGYVQGPNFGKATSGTQFVGPWVGQAGGRAMKVALGVRF
jgi:hypothetical protein